MRDAHRLPHDLIQVHEHFAPKQVVQLVLPRRVLGHQLLQRRGLVRRVVIDMQVGPLLETRAQEVDELLERSLLLGTVQTLERAESQLALVDGREAEQIFEPSFGREVRIAFHVEEDISRRSRREQSKAGALVNGQQVESMRASAAVLCLQRRLMAQPFKRDCPDSNSSRRVDL